MKLQKISILLWSISDHHYVEASNFFPILPSKLNKVSLSEAWMRNVHHTFKKRGEIKNRAKPQFRI